MASSITQIDYNRLLFPVTPQTSQNMKIWQEFYNSAVVSLKTWPVSSFRTTQPATHLIQEDAESDATITNFILPTLYQIAQKDWHFRVWQVSARVAFLATTEGAYMIERMEADAFRPASPFSKVSTALAACLRTFWSNCTLMPVPVAPFPRPLSAIATTPKNSFPNSKPN